MAHFEGTSCRSKLSFVPYVKTPPSWYHQTPDITLAMYLFQFDSRDPFQSTLHPLPCVAGIRNRSMCNANCVAFPLGRFPSIEKPEEKKKRKKDITDEPPVDNKYAPSHHCSSAGESNALLDRPVSRHCSIALAESYLFERILTNPCLARYSSASRALLASHAFFRISAVST